VMDFDALAKKAAKLAEGRVDPVALKVLHEVVRPGPATEAVLTEMGEAFGRTEVARILDAYRRALLEVGLGRKRKREKR